MPRSCPSIPQADLTVMKPLRMALFGGTFDPVHTGHLLLARDACEAAQLDRVVFIPAAQSPHKAAMASAGPHRIAMLQAALAGEAWAEVWPGEIEAGQLSYSVLTAEHWRKAYPQAELFWLLGGDQLAALPRWHRFERLRELLRFLVLARPGWELTLPPELPSQCVSLLEARQLDISATEVRQRAANGESLRWLVPEPVAAYIGSHQLYQRKA